MLPAYSERPGVLRTRASLPYGRDCQGQRGGAGAWMPAPPLLARREGRLAETMGAHEA